jgi:hypothetical protein
MDPAYVNDESAASGQPIRCQLVPVPPRVKSSRQVKPAAPPLVLEVSTNGAVRVIDANTKALIASDWLAQVMATPTMYRAGDDNNPSYTQPLVAVEIPGSEPLRIGPSPMGRSSGVPQFRYGWRGRVRGYKEPAYEVTEADWLTLVQKFGLGTRVVDENASGKIRQIRRRLAMTWLYWGLPLFILVAWVIHHFVR